MTDTDAYKRMARDLPDELGVTVELRITLHKNGALSVSAPLGDKALCYSMLDHARDAITRSTDNRIVIPEQDVELPQ